MAPHPLVNISSRFVYLFVGAVSVGQDAVRKPRFINVTHWTSILQQLNFVQIAPISWNKMSSDLKCNFRWRFPRILTHFSERLLGMLFLLKNFDLLQCISAFLLCLSSDGRSGSGIRKTPNRTLEWCGKFYQTMDLPPFLVRTTLLSSRGAAPALFFLTRILPWHTRCVTSFGKCDPSSSSTRPRKSQKPPPLSSLQKVPCPIGKAPEIRKWTNWSYRVSKHGMPVRLPGINSCLGSLAKPTHNRGDRKIETLPIELTKLTHEALPGQKHKSFVDSTAESCCPCQRHPLRRGSWLLFHPDPERTLPARKAMRKLIWH